MRTLQQAVKNTGCAVVRYENGEIGIFLTKEYGHKMLTVDNVKTAVQVFKTHGVIA